MQKKITKATFKTFIKKNINRGVYVKTKSDFDGMVDGVRPVKDDFTMVMSYVPENEHTLGMAGVWLVGSSRDYFTAYSDEQFEGIEVHNCCGNFIVATRKV
jgi:hypothetical protein